jgi:hypothetical protein
MLVLPRITAPASISFWTVGACSLGTNARRAGVAAVFGNPATGLSFTTSGTPEWPAFPAAIGVWRCAAASAPRDPG